MATKIDTEGFPLVKGEYIYNGVRMFPHTPLDLVNNVKDLEMKPEDLFICSYPKSGTTWLLEVVSFIYEGGKSDFTDTNLTMRIPFVEALSARESLQSSHGIFKSHLYPNQLPSQLWEKKAKIIHIIRDPRAVAVSYYFFQSSFDLIRPVNGDWNNFFEKLFTGNAFYGSWFDYIRAWYGYENMDNVFFISYEQMMKNPREAIKRVAHFLGKTLTEEQLSFIEKETKFDVMRNNPACNYSDSKNLDQSVSPFMRKGTVDDWKNQFNVCQTEKFLDIYRQETIEFDDFLKRYDVMIK